MKWNKSDVINLHGKRACISGLSRTLWVIMLLGGWGGADTVVMLEGAEGRTVTGWGAGGLTAGAEGTLLGATGALGVVTGVTGQTEIRVKSYSLPDYTITWQILADQDVRLGPLSWPWGTGWEGAWEGVTSVIRGFGDWTVVAMVVGHADRGLFAAERPSDLGRGWSILKRSKHMPKLY